MEAIDSDFNAINVINVINKQHNDSNEINIDMRPHYGIHENQNNTHVENQQEFSDSNSVLTDDDFNDKLNSEIQYSKEYFDKWWNGEIDPDTYVDDDSDNDTDSEVYLTRDEEKERVKQFGEYLKAQDEERISEEYAREGYHDVCKSDCSCDEFIDTDNNESSEDNENEFDEENESQTFVDLAKPSRTWGYI